MKHIEKDILFSLIEESLDADLRQKAEKHLDDCDSCFSMYANLKSSYTEIKSAKLKSAPADLIERTEVELGIVKEKPKPPPKRKPWDVPLEIIQNKLNDLLVPVLAPVTALLLIVFGLFRVYSPAIVRVADADSEVDSTITEPYEDDVKFENLAEQEEVKSNLTIEMQDQAQDVENIVLGAPETKAPTVTIPIELDEPLEMEFEVLAYNYEPDESDIETRKIPGPIKIPDLKGKSLDEIKRILEIKGIRYIIYRSIAFKQSVKPNDFLRSTDTLKVYLPK